MTPAEQVRDPARMVRLLWDPPPAGRSGLDVARITAAAIALADEQGAGAVTMRAVAQRLGVGTMSLYTHVPGKPELVELMYDRVLGELYADGDLPRHRDGWPDALRHVAARNWQLHLTHPGCGSSPPPDRPWARTWCRRTRRNWPRSTGSASPTPRWT